MNSIEKNISIIKKKRVRTEEKMKAVNELFLHGKKAVPSLVKEIVSPDWKTRWLIVSAIVFIGNDALPGLHRALKHKNWRMRGGVAEILSIIKSTKSISYLKKLLKDKNKRVKYYAQLSLDRFK